MGEWKLIKQKAIKWLKNAKKIISDALAKKMLDHKEKT